MPPQSSFTRQPFKAPRPIGSSATGSGITTPGAAASRSNKTAGPRNAHRAALPELSSDDEMNDVSQLDNVGAESSQDDKPSDTRKSNNAATSSASQDASKLQVVPPQLLSKLVHNHFQHEDTRITKEAMSVFEKYVETFVKEAIYRAHFERKKQEGDDGFLDVCDVYRCTIVLANHASYCIGRGP